MTNKGIIANAVNSGTVEVGVVRGDRVGLEVDVAVGVEVCVGAGFEKGVIETEPSGKLRVCMSLQPPI